MTMQLSPNGIAKLIQWEGEVLNAYDDQDPQHRPVKPGQKIRGTLTIGVGHTGKDVYPGLVWTKEQSRAALMKDTQWAQNAVNKYVRVKLTQNQFDALVSLCFNIGEGNFSNSTLVRELNKGNFDAAPIQFMKWVNVQGKRNKGLVNRRSAELGLWATGAYVASTVAVADPETTDVEFAKPKGTTVGIVGTGLGGTGVGGLGLLNEAKDQLGQFSGFTYVQYVLLALTVVGFAFGAYSTYQTWKRNRP